MIGRFLLLLALLPTCLAAQNVDAPPVAPKPETVNVVLTTSEGPITIEVEKQRAPITAANFLKYVDQKRLDGANFYRAVKVQDNFGLVQFGVRNDPKRVLPNIAHEPTSKTGLTHVDGTISMARAAPGTASGDFFITLGEQASMNADPSQPGDNLGYAAFGRVVGGMDVIHKIFGRAHLRHRRAGGDEGTDIGRTGAHPHSTAVRLRRIFLG